jgi:hypothetical protein
MTTKKEGESGGSIDGQLPYTNIFKIEDIPDFLSDIASFLITIIVLDGYYATYKRHIVVRATNYHLIVGKLYMLGLDNMIRRFLIDHEKLEISWECHNRVAGGIVGGKSIARRYLSWIMVDNYLQRFQGLCQCLRCMSKGQ